MSERPLLKGVFHLLATITYLTAFPYLKSLIPPGLELSFTIYTLSIIGNFACSTLLHIIHWSKDNEVYLRRLDHVMIFIMIASTYYAAISTIMHDINSIVLYILWTGTLIGIATRLFFTDAPKIFISLPYFLIGWSLLFDPYIIFKLIERVPDGSLIALLGGLSYSLGAIIYTLEKPKLWPKYMSYHEVFHILSIIGSTLFAVCLFNHGIPYYQEKLT